MNDVIDEQIARTAYLIGLQIAAYHRALATKSEMLSDEILFLTRDYQHIVLNRQAPCSCDDTEEW